MSSQDFPAGLAQPAGSYRFGLDALLLAGFGKELIENWQARRGGTSREIQVVELGCGSGAALLALALAMPSISCLGLDASEELIWAARQNAKVLGLEKRAVFAQHRLPFPVQDIPEPWRRSLLALANPPWHPIGSGRPPRQELRKAALFRENGMLHAFSLAASKLLVHKGYYACILPPEQLMDFCASLEKTGLGLRRMLPVCSFSGENAQRLLLLCQKSARHDPVLNWPLIIHKKSVSAVDWTEEAVRFCPWLAGDVKNEFYS